MQLGVFLGVNAGRASDVGGADDPPMHGNLHDGLTWKSYGVNNTIREKDGPLIRREESSLSFFNILHCG